MTDERAKFSTQERVDVSIIEAYVERSKRDAEDLKRFREREPLVQALLDALAVVTPYVDSLAVLANRIRSFKVSGS
jgi:mevalonate kinase